MDSNAIFDKPTLQPWAQLLAAIASVAILAIWAVGFQAFLNGNAERQTDRGLLTMALLYGVIAALLTFR